MQVPEERFDAVAAQVNALPEVAHNYRREHALQHVVRARLHVAGAGRRAPARASRPTTGLRVYAFPKEKEFFVELRLPV